MNFTSRASKMLLLKKWLKRLIEIVFLVTVSLLVSLSNPLLLFFSHSSSSHDTPTWTIQVWRITCNEEQVSFPNKMVTNNFFSLLLIIFLRIYLCENMCVCVCVNACIWLLISSCFRAFLVPFICQLFWAFQDLKSEKLSFHATQCQQGYRNC